MASAKMPLRMSSSAVLDFVVSVANPSAEFPFLSSSKKDGSGRLLGPISLAKIFSVCGLRAEGQASARGRRSAGGKY